MVAYFRNPIKRTQALALCCIAACGIIAAFVSVILSGTKTGAVLSVGLTVGPALLYAVITAPVAFPFGLYAIMTPYDSILDMPQFGTLTKLIGIATGAALVFYMLRTKRFNDPPRNLILWVLYYLWIAASMFWAMDVENAQKLLPTALELFALYVVASMMPMNVKTLRIASIATAVGGITAALYGLRLYRSGVAEFKDRLWVRTDSGSWNPDHYAASLLLPIAICLIALLWSRNLFVRIVAAFGIGVMMLTMVYTGARGAALGLCALVVYLLIRDRHRVQIAVCGALLGAIALIFEGPKYAARWQDAAASGGSGRLSIWKVGWHAFEQNWLYGAGYGNFPMAYDRAFIGVYEPFFAQWHRASHNIILGGGVELGVIGLSLLLLAWFGQFRMLRGISETDERWPFRLAFEGSLIALFVSGLFADIMIQKYVWLAFMLVAFTSNALPQRAVQRSTAEGSVLARA